MDAASTHDLFISFASVDEAWVRGYLIPELGPAPDRIMTRRDFTPGASMAREVERAVSSSRYTVLVMSRAYLNDEWAGFGEDLATLSSVESNAARLIPLVLEPIDIPLRLRYRVRLECETEGKWADAARQLRELLDQPEPGPEPPIPCPYPGMSPFDASRSDEYFGRSALITSTIERLRLQSFIALIGPSGSGKSSFLHAGLMPRLEKHPLLGGRPIKGISIRPGRNPLAKLAASLGTELGRDPREIESELEGAPTALVDRLDDVSARAPRHLGVLIVDQFEEIFTPSVTATDRQRFLDALDAVLAASREAWRVIVGVRADFYDDCQESSLWPRIEGGLLNLPPMSRDGLREAIREPAARRGVFVEPALIERLIDDAEDEPGPLPLLQETMVLLWSSHLRRRLLTLASYDRLSEDGHSGLQIAMRNRAETTIRGLAKPAQEAIARRIFVRLTEFAERRNTRRQQSLQELVTSADDEPAVRVVIDVLVSHGLLTTDRDEASGEPLIDLAHEKLIDAWPRFQKWLDAYEPVEAERRTLVHATASWNDNRRERSYLYAGRRLKAASAWAEEWPGEIGDLEREFLDASRRNDRRRQVLGVAAVGAVALLVAVIAVPLVLGENRRRETGSRLKGFNAGPAVIYEDRPDPGDHTVTVQSFRIEVAEVSVGQYRRCVDAGRCDKPFGIEEHYWSGQPTYPIVWTSAEQAETYCTWIDRRLPTWIEWQRAVRGTEGRAFPWGDSPPPESLEELLPVDSTPETATSEGIFHLVDNAGEWLVTPGSETPFGVASGYDTQPEEAFPGAVLPSNGVPDPGIGFRCAVDGA